jgi:tetratricopeptide (TPR) repeat protein
MAFSPDAFETYDVAAVEKKVLAALDARQFDRVTVLLEKVAHMNPVGESVVEELLPAVEALEASDWEGLFWRLTEETTFDSRTEDKMLEIAATELEKAKESLLAAAAWSRWRGIDGPQRAERLVSALGLPNVDALKPRVRDAAIEYYKGRIARDERDAAAWERYGYNVLDKGDAATAVEACTKACRIQPSRKIASQLVADVMVASGQAPKAVKWLKEVGKANPGQAWPWILLAQLHEGASDWDAAMQASARAVEEDDEDRPAMYVHRRILRKLQKWHDLAAHVEKMMSGTNRLRELIELHDELADLLAQKLNSPLEGVEIRKRADFFRDQPGVAAYYWQNLRQAEDDETMWKEVEDFFRTNEFWEDLGKLLFKKAERVSGLGIVQIYDDLAMVYTFIPGQSPASLVEPLRGEISRCRDAEARAHLEERLKEFENWGKQAETEERVDSAWGAMIWVIGALILLFLIGGVVAVVMLVL